MAKPDPQRLQLAAYPIHRHTEPRFGDVDALRHLNNVALGRIYEDARVRFFDGIGIREAFEPGSGFVMAELTIQYLAEGQFPDPLIVGTGVVKVGGASAAVGQGLLIQAAWVVAAYLLARWVWSRGIRKYSAVGG